MLDRAKDETDLNTILGRIAITEDLIERQFDRIEQLRTEQKDTKEASEDLRLMIHSLYLLEEQKAVVTARLRGERGSHGGLVSNWNPLT